MSIQRIFANNTNIIDAVTADVVNPSSSVWQESAERSGNGTVELRGNYTGFNDAGYEIEITGVSGQGRTSTPVFSGQGTGNLSNVVAGTLNPQSISITLSDMGISTSAASLDFFGVTLKAKSAGAVGNAVRISIDRSGIVPLAAGYSLFESISEGQKILNGPENNFGATVLNGSGEMNADAPRLLFGDDPQVFRQYKRFSSGAWEYVLTPAAPRFIPAGTAIRAITGTYNATVTDGSVTESYTNIITLYDLLSQLAGSALIEVIGAVTRDLQPEGMAAIDLPLRTDAYSLPLQTSGYATRLEGLVIPDAAPTELLSIECVDNTMIGREVWNVKGTANGSMPQAQTGVNYVSRGYQFTIPVELPTQAPSSGVANPGGITISETAWVNRNESEQIPDIGIRAGILGRAGFSGRLSATWTKYNKTADCNWQDAVVTGSLSPEFLGLDTIGGDVMALDPAYKTRLQLLYEWREEFVRLNTSNLPETITTVVPVMGSVVTGSIYVKPNSTLTINFPERSFETSAEAWSYLNGFFGNWIVTGSVPGTRVFTLQDWSDVTGTVVYLGGQYVANGFRTADGGTTGKVFTVICRKFDYDYILTELAYSQTNIRKELINTFDTWFSTQPSAESFIESILTHPSVDRNNAGSSLAVSPLQLSSNTVISTKSNYQAAALDIPFMQPFFDLLLTSLSKSYASAPALALWDTLKTDIFADIAGLKVTVGNDLSTLAMASYIERYRSRIDLILLAAGIVPGKGSGSAGGTGCWSDLGTDYWQLDDGYLPLYNNVIGYSAKKDAEGNPYSTMEFALAIAVKCEDLLKHGDRITISFSGEGNRAGSSPKTYQPGDYFKIPVIAASPAYLTGGVDGNDTVTWGIVGGVSGALTPYPIVNNTPGTYLDVATGFSFNMALGGIPFALGDNFTLSVEGGTFRWRKGNGAWSAGTGIADTVLSDGLTAAFTAGAAPSFVPGDLFAFTAKQPSSPANVKTPKQDERWIFTGTGTISLTAPSVGVSALCIVHNMPVGTIISLSTLLFGIDEIVTTDKHISIIEGDEETLATLSIMFTPPNITDVCEVAYIYLGTPLTTQYAPAAVKVERKWKMLRGGSANFGAQYLAQGVNGSFTFENSMNDTEFAAHLEMVEHVKANNDEPVVVLPHYKHPSEAFLCRIAADSVSAEDLMQYHPDNTSHRILTMELPFEAVYQ